jgi:ribonuclease D
MNVAPEPIMAPPAALRHVGTRRDDTTRRLTALRKWRAGAARAAAVDPVVVCTDSELSRLARRPPRNLDDIAETVGTLFARRHGDAIVRALSDVSDG